MKDLDVNYYKDRVFLITGGAGSIGSNLAYTMAQLGAKSIRVLDSDENGLFNFNLNIPKDIQGKFRLLLGDVRDKDRVKLAVDGVDVAYHMAALKHVEIGGFNPFEVVKTNVIGTQNVIESVLDDRGVEKLIFCSSDKAANPVGTYGVSKLLGEHITLSASSYRGDRKTEFCCYRFGNVVGTRGNVWFVWGKQLKRGEPLTVRGEQMRRYFIEMDDLINFILKTTPIIKDREIIVPKMKEYKILDVAKTMGNVVIERPRKGEKLSEDLVASYENAEDCGEYWVIKGG